MKKWRIVVLALVLLPIVGCQDGWTKDKAVRNDQDVTYDGTSGVKTRMEFKREAQPPAPPAPVVIYPEPKIDWMVMPDNQGRNWLIPLVAGMRPRLLSATTQPSGRSD